MSENAQNPIHVLDSGACWEMLRQNEFGRLAYHLVGEVHIVPINYAVDEDDRLIFMTAEGSKLLGITMNEDVAFEIDDITGEHAKSVIVRGSAHQLQGSEKYVVEKLPLRPWVNTPKFSVVAITVNDVSGRYFDLTRPWTHMRVDEAGDED